MCRHLAYLGPPVTVRALVLDPPYGLARQAWAPRRPRHGTMNVDGFGIGWYADGDPVPARYRRAGPIWADPGLADLARVTRTRALLAAVRSATEGCESGAAAAAPYASGRWLFSHNGVLNGWPAATACLGAGLPAADLLALEARCDSALAWALVADRLKVGTPPGQALASVIADLGHHDITGRFNFLLTDGEVISATAAGNTLCYRAAGPHPPAGPGVVVASEPGDDEPGWTEVPEGSVLTATADAVEVHPLPMTPPPPAAGMEEGRKDPRFMTALHVERCLPEGYLDRALRADARAGLSASPKTLPPKWLYDENGSELFEKITQLDEYYPTRAERSILATVVGEIAAATGASTLVELGAGAADKTRLLLDALRAAGTLRSFVPVDVSETALIDAAHRVLASYPGLCVRAVVSDFEEHRGLPDASGPRLVAFLGGTIGNLVPDQRAAFLASVRSRLGPGDALLLGTDLVKDPRVLQAAYDDAAGVTAAFNKNVLAVLNARLGANFDLTAFDHVALWDPVREWVEMRLRSAVQQVVTLPDIGLTVVFAEGEEMRTEVSAKFRPDGIAAELSAAGFTMRHWWTDTGGRFGLSLSVPA